MDSERVPCSLLPGESARSRCFKQADIKINHYIEIPRSLLRGVFNTGGSYEEQKRKKKSHQQ